MRKLFLALVFVLAGTFAFANVDLYLSTSEETLEMECFDFYDSCGGAWDVCHEGVSTSQLVAFLWEWDGGC